MASSPWRIGPKLYDGLPLSAAPAHRASDLDEEPGVPLPTATATAALNLGFLTVLHEASGYLGGYLVTNTWGRPIEFRLSTAVQPNRVQQILYGGTLQPYICAELIGKTLIDKTGTPVQLVLTDNESVLELRRVHDCPVAWLSAPGEPLAAALSRAGAEVLPARGSRGPVFRHSTHAADGAFIRETLERLDSLLDLTEPFVRIREAVAEARKMGVTGRG